MRLKQVIWIIRNWCYWFVFDKTHFYISGCDGWDDFFGTFWEADNDDFFGTFWEADDFFEILWEAGNAKALVFSANLGLKQISI